MPDKALLALIGNFVQTHRLNQKRKKASPSKTRNKDNDDFG